METKIKPAIPRLPVRISKCEGGRRLALVNKDGGLISYIDVAAEAYAPYIARAANAYPKLVEALHRLIEVTQREDAHLANFGEFEAACALLRELGEGEHA